ADVAEEDPVRHRPDRQVVPQRDHPGELPLPDPGVRADGDGALRPARHRRGMAPALDRRAPRLVCRPRQRPAGPAALRAPEGNTDFDDASAIGRRYRRQDEIGTPYCITVDFDTLEDQAVTVRDRDTMQQERVGIDALEGYLAERLGPC